MRKIFIFFLFGILPTQAQETVANPERKNDVTLSPIELIEVPILNISYDRLVSENFGVGVNGLFYFGKNSDSDRFTQLSPFFRSYFGKKYASGFFVEGFIPVTMTRENYRIYDDSNMNYTLGYESSTTVGLGFGLGVKLISRKNILFESSFGIAKRFGEAKNYFSFNATGKWMVGIGYRF